MRHDGTLGFGMLAHQAFIGLGSNVGDGPAEIQKALTGLQSADGIEVLRVSSLYSTAAWGRTDQADFTNAVAEISTHLSALQLLQVLLQLEAGMGRKRDSGHWGPRLIDLDILSYGHEHLSTADLMLPHPRMHERAFVLIPLLELDPEYKIPGLGLASKWLEKLPDQWVRRII